MKLFHSRGRLECSRERAVLLRGTTPADMLLELEALLGIDAARTLCIELGRLALSAKLAEEPGAMLSTDELDTLCMEREAVP